MFSPWLKFKNQLVTDKNPQWLCGLLIMVVLTVCARVCACAHVCMCVLKGLSSNNLQANTIALTLNLCFALFSRRRSFVHHFFMLSLVHDKSVTRQTACKLFYCNKLSTCVAHVCLSRWGCKETSCFVRPAAAMSSDWPSECL